MSAWVEHIKKVAEKEGISYSVALKSGKAKESYVKKVKPLAKQPLAKVEEKVEPKAEQKPLAKKKSVKKLKIEEKPIEVPLEIIEEKLKVKKIKVVKEKAVEAPAPM
jgi:hypothetical protein